MSDRRSAGEGAIYRRTFDFHWVGSLCYSDPITGAGKRAVVYGDSRKVVVEKLKIISTRLDAGQLAVGRKCR